MEKIEILPKSLEEIFSVLEKKVKEMIDKSMFNKEIKKIKITPETRFGEDLGWDDSPINYEVISFEYAIESELKIKIPDGTGCETVGDYVNYIKENFDILRGRYKKFWHLEGIIFSDEKKQEIK